MTGKLPFVALSLAAILFAAACEGDTTVNTAPADTTGITVTGRGAKSRPLPIPALSILASR